MSYRQETIAHFQQKPDVSVLILGGGVNGIGLYRELALQGIDCLLVDKADFVAGASSKSSRMIHGGLRYLENREFELVSESLIERNRLLENAPHYVSPLKTTIPLLSWFGGLFRSIQIFLGFRARPGLRGIVPIKFGLMFYDWITRKQRLMPRHHFTSRKNSIEQMPEINEKIVATATYWDAWITQAERLCIEMIRDAREANAECHALNYAASFGVEDGAVVLKDEVAGDTFTVRPKIVINAAGSWVDKVNASLGLDTHYMSGTKGSHLVVESPALHRALAGQMAYYQHADGRVCIMFPFLGRVIMGTTDIAVEDPDMARCEEAEVDYILTTFKDAFPKITVTRDDVVFVYCGVRPLPASDRAFTANISRGHSFREIEPTAERPFPIHCIIGGKWTTFRALAEQAADQTLAYLERERICSTENLPIGGGKDCPRGDDERTAWVTRVARSSRLAEERVRDLLDRYGSVAEAMANAAGEQEPLKTLPSYGVGEIRRIAREEQVEHLTDLVCRRSTIAIIGLASDAVLRELAGIVGAELGWDEARQAAEVEQAFAEVRVPVH